VFAAAVDGGCGVCVVVVVVAVVAAVRAGGGGCGGDVDVEVVREAVEVDGGWGEDELLGDC
jgi:hypothetical protein